DGHRTGTVYGSLAVVIFIKIIEPISINVLSDLIPAPLLRLFPVFGQAAGQVLFHFFSQD
ncbi:MAG: hypothetical protein MUO54_06245, partial [Anaerolineales bacterium]|nr:hypothetical protein [Anaerolineales bacterium]